MCVIIVAKKRFPKLPLLQLGEACNRDGGGIAWIKNGKVHFRKDITSWQMAQIGRENPEGPWMIHFRLATMGGPIPQLTHPFVVSEDSSLALTGTANEVMMHNGHWGGAHHYMQDPTHLAMERQQEPWSDSRFMAVMMARHGEKFTEYVTRFGQKVSTLTPEGVKMYGEWSAVMPDCWLSTDILWYKSWSKSGPNIHDYLYPEDAESYEDQANTYWMNWSNSSRGQCNPTLWEGEEDEEAGAINIELVEGPDLLEDEIDRIIDDQQEVNDYLLKHHHPRMYD